MILYFSATGNGKYIAEQIAEKTDEKCMSIVDCICEDKYCFSNEKIFGMVVPTYFWRLPRIVAEYLGKLRIENCGYTFFLTSYGATTGEAGSMAKKIMAHNGQNFDAYYSVIMPDTWTPIFDLTNKNRVDKWLSDGKKQLKLVIGNIMSKRKGERQMRIGVTYENGEIFQHFGHTEQFKLYDVENGEIKQTQVVDTNGQGHGALSSILTNAGVEVLICGGIGGGAQTALAAAGIQLFGSVSGNADEAVKNYIAGNLNYNPEVHCTHHEHEHSCGEHHCSEDKHGCNGNAGNC